MKNKYTKVIGQIYKTNEYDKFRKILGNRPLIANKSLKDSIEQNGQLVPIKVNEFYEIIDGQNRFNYLKELGLPVEYYISDNYNKKHIPSINSSPKHWTVENFMNFHADNGVEEYIKMRDFYLQSKLNLTLIIAGGMGYKAGTSSKVTKLFKDENGDKYNFFNAKQLQVFEEFYLLFINKVVVKPEIKIENALWTLFNQPNFDGKRMIKKAIALGVKEDLKNSKTESYVLKVLFEAYQNSLEERSQFYIKHQFSSKGDLIFQTKK